MRGTKTGLLSLAQHRQACWPRFSMHIGARRQLVNIEAQIFQLMVHDGEQKIYFDIRHFSNAIYSMS